MLFTINWMESVDSTNNEALKHIREVEHFTIYVSKFQHVGKGQRGNSWESENGKNLLFSIVIKKCEIKAVDQFIMAQLISVAIKRYLGERGVEAMIKWPNDIYIGERKVCGILIEHLLTGDKLSASVIGVGININQERFISDAPNPVSLKMVTGVEYNLEEELERITTIFAELYHPFMESSFEEELTALQREYIGSLYRFGEYHHYEEAATGTLLEGKIVEIDKSGVLSLELKSGEIKSYYFKEIKYHH